MFDLQKPVGINCANQKSDVELVQFALNLVPTAVTWGLTRVPVDGKFGPNTLNAIMAFQSTFMRKPDGVVNPMRQGGVTVLQLNIVQSLADQYYRKGGSLEIGLRETGPDPRPLPKLTAAPFFSRRSSWTLESGSVDLLVEYVAVSGGTFDVKYPPQKESYKLPFAAVGGGYGLQPFKALEKLFKLPPGLLDGFIENFSNRNKVPLAGIAIDLMKRVAPRYAYPSFLVAAALKYVGVAQSWLVPYSAPPGGVFISNAFDVRELRRSDFGGGVLVLSAGAGVIAGFSGSAVLFGFEANNPFAAAFNPKGIAFPYGMNMGANFGASVTLTAGYVSDLEFG
jgi:hypothetical protein